MNEYLIKKTLEHNKCGPYYSIENEIHLSNRNNSIKTDIGIIFSDDKSGKILHKHGEFYDIEKLYHDSYQKLSFFNFKLLRVPLNKYYWVNTVINISASNWLDLLIDECYKVEIND